MNIEKYENYVKIGKFTDIELKLTQSQSQLIQKLLIEIGELEHIFKTTTIGLSLDIFISILSKIEGQNSSLIEGTKTQYEDFSYDIEGIDNSYSWETRNLIILYIESQRLINDGAFFISIDSVRRMHIDLFSTSSFAKFPLVFNPKKIIDRVKPGKIIENDERINWIGRKTNNRKKDLINASIIPILPSLKHEYLKDMFESLHKKVENNTLLITDIIKFHPIFEAVHPFSDGNGRIGRLLWIALLKLQHIGSSFLFTLSEAIYNKKDQYLEELKNVQLTNNWSSWSSFCIELLIDAKRTLQIKIPKIINLWAFYYAKIKLSALKITILKYYFKYFNLHKQHTIKKLIEKGFSNTSTYRAFGEVTNMIGAIPNGKYFKFNELIKIIE